jgi:hypothetical protein
LEANSLVKHAQVDQAMVDGRTYHLEQPEEQKALVRAIDEHLYSAKSVREREAFLTCVREKLSVPPTLREEEPAQPLTWAEVKEMEESGWITFGAHTLHHPILRQLEDPLEVRREVVECRSVLEQHLAHPVYSFAYPIGKPEDIGDDGFCAVKAAGYKWAVTTIEGVNTPQTDPLLLQRLPGDINKHWLIMASELVGLLAIWSRLKQKLKQILTRK